MSAPVAELLALRFAPPGTPLPGSFSERLHPRFSRVIPEPLRDEPAALGMLDPGRFVAGLLRPWQFAAVADLVDVETGGVRVVLPHVVLRQDLSTNGAVMHVFHDPSSRFPRGSGLLGPG